MPGFSFKISRSVREACFHFSFLDEEAGVERLNDMQRDLTPCLIFQELVSVSLA